MWAPDFSGKTSLNQSRSNLLLPRKTIFPRKCQGNAEYRFPFAFFRLPPPHSSSKTCSLGRPWRLGGFLQAGARRRVCMLEPPIKPIWSVTSEPCNAFRSERFSWFQNFKRVGVFVSDFVSDFGFRFVQLTCKLFKVFITFLLIN